MSKQILTLEQLKKKVIENGIKSIRKHEKRQERIEGALEGFRICEKLNTPMEFEWELKKRRKEEMKLIDDGISTKEYWQYRYATLQIEYCFEILKVAWEFPTVSARAVIKYSELIGVKL